MIYQQGPSSPSFLSQGSWTVKYFLWYPFGAWKTTYDLRFFIASSAAFGTLFTTILSTDRSLFAVSSRHRASSSLLPLTSWYKSQPVPKIQWQSTTHIFYINDQFSNGECHLNWIGIDTSRQLLEERLHKARTHSKMVFDCMRLWIRSYNSRKVGFAVVLFFETSIFQMQ